MSFYLSKTRFLLYFLFVVGIFSCNTSEEKPPVPQLLKDMVIKISEPDNPEVRICYQLDSIHTWADRNAFKEKFSKNQLEIIYALNRIDESKVGPGHELIVPDTLLPNLIQYAPCPEHLELLKDVPKVVLIAQRLPGIAL